MGPKFLLVNHFIILNICPFLFFFLLLLPPHLECWLDLSSRSLHLRVSQVYICKYVFFRFNLTTYLTERERKVFFFFVFLYSFEYHKSYEWNKKKFDYFLMKEICLQLETWFLLPYMCYLVLIACYLLVPDTFCFPLAACYILLVSLYLLPATRNLLPNTLYLILVIWFLLPDTCYLILVTRYLLLNTCYQILAT